MYSLCSGIIIKMPTRWDWWVVYWVSWTTHQECNTGCLKFLSYDCTYPKSFTTRLLISVQMSTCPYPYTINSCHIFSQRSISVRVIFSCDAYLQDYTSFFRDHYVISGVDVLVRSQSASEPLGRRAGRACSIELWENQVLFCLNNSISPIHHSPQF